MKTADLKLAKDLKLDMFAIQEFSIPLYIDTPSNTNSNENSDDDGAFSFDGNP